MSDDYAGNTATAGAVAVGGNTTGNIEIVGDKDWFKVMLQAGSTYLFDLSGADSGGGTLGLGTASPYLRLYNTSGGLAESSVSGGTNGDPRMSFQPTVTGTHYLEVSTLSDNGTGTYKLSASLSTLADDYFATSATTGTVAVGGNTTGNIEIVGDKDWFKVTLQAGSTYLFDLSGADSGGGTLGLGTASPYLRLYNTSGGFVESSVSGGTNGDPRMSFQPTVTGTHYLEVSTLSDNGTGTYKLSASDINFGVVLAGTPSSDELFGTGGDDRIDGGPDADRLFGGLGDDVYLVDSQADLVFEYANEGTDTVLSTTSFYLYANIENLTLSGSAQFGVGNALANTLTGNDQENLLIGWDGNDTLSGGSARDALFGVDGNDVLRGDAGIDYIVAGSGDDTLLGGADADEMYGQEGNDSLLGGDDFATDIPVGGEGNDTLDGGPAWDLMYGGAGDDTYMASQQIDWVFESPGEGNDTVIADSPNGYYLYDNVENLILVGETPFGVGNALGNLITGNTVSNVLLGGAGADTLDGGAGLDILWGQDGADTFRIGKGTGVDIVADFQVGVDKLDLSAFGLSTLAQAKAQAKAQMTQVGSDISVQLGNGDSVILIGVSFASLSASDFVLPPGGG